MKTGAQDVLTIDPAAMNVTNRIARGGHLNGRLLFDGGLLVQGELTGHLGVRGHLIIWSGATVRGRISVSGDIYVFGCLGDPDAPATQTSVECTGMVCVAQSGSSSATLLARRLQLYDGANVRGPFKTLRPGEEVPVLSDPAPATT